MDMQNLPSLKRLFRQNEMRFDSISGEAASKIESNLEQFVYGDKMSRDAV